MKRGSREASLNFDRFLTQAETWSEPGNPPAGALSWGIREAGSGSFERPIMRQAEPRTSQRRARD